MENPHKVILSPRVTEKAMMGSGGELAQYHFQVDLRADKIQVKLAVERIYDVKVESVNIINCKGKPKRLGRFMGRRSHWKKAVVTLKEGHTIDMYEA